jgi:hypothetical protein
MPMTTRNARRAAAPKLTDLPLATLLAIAGASSAQDVFSLVQCWKALWEDRKTKRIMLRRALEARLGDCLRAAKPAYRETWRPWRLSAEDIFPPAAEPAGAPQVLIAGSVPVAAALGKVWTSSDVDIFCTWSAAASVRQRLVERCGLICSGGNDTYGSPIDTCCAPAPERSARDACAMDHVEGYAPCPTAGGQWNPYITPVDASDTREFATRAKYGDKKLRDTPATVEEFLEQANEFGRETLQDPTEKQLQQRAAWPSGHWTKKIGAPGGCGPGRAFPYNFELASGTFVQLIVGKEGCEDARELLNSFDLTICTTYFDGITFHIPSPRQTLSGQTCCLAPRHAVLTNYFQTAVDQVLRSESGAYVFSEIIEGMADDIWDEVGPRSRGWEDRHDFMMKLIIRMQKYYKRGVKIVNVPGDLRLCMHALNFQSVIEGGRGDYVRTFFSGNI